MKYWKGKSGTLKDGYCGTMNDNGFVPDSVEISEQEYLDWVGSQSVPEAVDYKTEYGKLVTGSEKIDYIAKRLNLKD